MPAAPVWSAELFDCGDLLSDDVIHDEADQAECERRWNRYVELADTIAGDEGIGGVRALLRSFRAPQDHGAYESAFGALQRFPPDVLGRGVARAARTLENLHEEYDGVILLTVARTPGAPEAFNAEAADLDIGLRIVLRRLIGDFEADEGWLEDDRGVLVVPR